MLQNSSASNKTFARPFNLEWSNIVPNWWSTDLTFKNFEVLIFWDNLDQPSSPTNVITNILDQTSFLPMALMEESTSDSRLIVSDWVVEWPVLCSFLWQCRSNLSLKNCRLSLNDSLPPAQRKKPYSFEKILNNAFWKFQLILNF